jgi:hypothetical protein
MISDPHLLLSLHAARAGDLRAEAAHHGLVRALRRHGSTADIDGSGAAPPPRPRWPWRRRAEPS